MGIIGIIAVGIAAISGYKYCKEDDFREKVKKASEWVQDEFQLRMSRSYKSLVESDEFIELITRYEVRKEV